MDKKQDETTPYPADYAHLVDKVKTVQELAQQIDQQIKNVPQNSKPQPILTPIGVVQRRYFNRERTIASLNKQKDDLKYETLAQVEQEVKEADPKTARQVRDQAREELFPNHFRRMGVQEKNTYHSQPKDIEESQNYMDAMFYAPKNKREKEKETKPEPKPFSMSLRFSQSLSSLTPGETTGKTAKSDIEPEKD
ncbi:hypothetical protein [Spirosoma sp. KNUC1025]|uniref:hypothetical protein n=1 Tax=Spirosoma sp. KNUC1025 TaxID=2894082 RepID=UPI003863CDEC|nr:hypothetical protein LN737_01140 [Spirosoma sp. KNUC1025]